MYMLTFISTRYVDCHFVDNSMMRTIIIHGSQDDIYVPTDGGGRTSNNYD